MLGYTNNKKPPAYPWDFGWTSYPYTLPLNTSKLECGCNKVTLWTYENCKCDAKISFFLPPQSCQAICEKRHPMLAYDRKECKCECLNYCCKTGYAREDSYPCRCIPKLTVILASRLVSNP